MSSTGGSSADITFRCESAGLGATVYGAVGVSFNFEGCTTGEHQDAMVILSANTSIAGFATLEPEWPVTWPAESGCATITVSMSMTSREGELTFDAAIRIGPVYRAPA